jgi:hypothetical protein
VPSPLHLGAAGRPCGACGAPLAVDQRYCLACGERAAVRRLDPLAQARGAAAVATVEAPGGAGPPSARAIFALPSAQLAAAAVLVTLGFGVVAGGVSGSGGDASAAGLAGPLVVFRGAPPPAVAAAAPTPSGGGGSGRGDVAAVAPPADPAPTPLATPASPAPDPTPAPVGGTDTPALPDAPTTAPLKHIWLITLTGHGATAFAEGSAATYLRSQVAKGVLLQNYTAIAHGSLPNGLAVLTGQGPTPQTLSDCPAGDPFVPAGKAGADGQRPGTGCVLPADIPSLPAQLTDSGRTWKAYVEDLPATPPGEAPSCGRDGYVTPRDPFVYLAGVTAAPECASSIVGTDQLANDLANPDNTPTLSYVVPGACHDGSDTPCADGAPAGLTAADAWLQSVLGPILASAAYADGGMVFITFDAAPADGPEADSTAAPWLPARWPNAPDGPAPGGGKVGALVLSPFAPAGTVVSDPYDHISLLRTIEDVFGFDRLGYAGAKDVKPFGADILRPSAS